MRWMYFTRELAEAGADVHVLTVIRGSEPGRLDVPPGVCVYRVGSSLVSGAMGVLKGDLAPERLYRRTDATAIRTRPDPVTGSSERLNWKGRLVTSADRLLRGFADARRPAIWRWFARSYLVRLLDRLSPDVVISSHEPRETLLLGLVAKGRGFKWLADLGDPVLAFYTPPGERRRAARIERQTCIHADRLIVTSEAAKHLLCARHGVEPGKLEVLTQGFDWPLDGLTGENREAAVEFSTDTLELLYTGSFYRFREPRALVDSVLASEGVRLTVATRVPPEWLVEAARRAAGRIRLLGFLPHAEVLALQRAADVLVNIANDDPVHLPGKVFEYLGAGVPILHLTGTQADAAESLIVSLRRGLVAENTTQGIGQALEEFKRTKRNSGWEDRFDLGQRGLEAYSWSGISARLGAILESVAGGSGACVGSPADHAPQALMGRIASDPPGEDR